MFVKLFAQIFDSSIADNYALRHFFMDMLILADADGFVDMTPTAIAARTRIPLAEVTAMLALLEQPDPESRTPDADGRRIERLDTHRSWGWRIINYASFRKIANNEQRKASQRERFQRWKSKQIGAANASLTPANASNAMQKQKQKDKQKQKQRGKKVSPYANYQGWQLRRDLQQTTDPLEAKAIESEIARRRAKGAKKEDPDVF
jgi:hypothetical protein